jgi:dephospho-CoA kinase
MLRFNDFVIDLEEGIHDPARLKAIFMAGGPGSGKSYVARKTMQGLGFKFVNSDDLFEKGMQQAGLDPTMPPEETERRDEVRAKAKSLTDKRQKLYQQGGLGMVIDGTGKDAAKIKAQSEALRQQGYDTHMVFVNTSHDVAQQRNADRARSLPREHVTNMWQQVQNNIGHFQHHFGNDNLHIVDNNDASENLLAGVHKTIRKIATSPVKNRTGQQLNKEQTPQKTD